MGKKRKLKAFRKVKRQKNRWVREKYVEGGGKTSRNT